MKCKQGEIEFPTKLTERLRSSSQIFFGVFETYDDE